MHYCKHCGLRATTIAALTTNVCSRHPLGPNRGRHTLYQGAEKSRYECQYCGLRAPSIAGLTTNTCQRHPLGAGKGRHEPAL